MTATEQLLALGWTPSADDTLLCSSDPATGGIIDKAIASGEWFAVFNDDALGGTIEGFATREDAARAAIRKFLPVTNT